MRLPRRWPFHRHRWQTVEQTGHIATQLCACRKTRVRVT